jgi:hypothetical protein
LARRRSAIAAHTSDDAMWFYIGLLIGFAVGVAATIITATFYYR